jgi:hypothetical protein
MSELVMAFASTPAVYDGPLFVNGIPSIIATENGLPFARLPISVIFSFPQYYTVLSRAPPVCNR